MAQQMAQQASQAEQAGRLREALAQYDGLLARYPTSDAAALVFEKRALAAEQAGHLQEALGWYERLLFFHPTFERAYDAQARYARLLVAAHRSQEGLALFQALYPHAPTPDARARLGLAWAHALRETGQASQALHIYVELAHFQDLHASARQHMADQARAVVQKDLQLQDIFHLWTETRDKRPWRFLHPLLSYQLALRYQQAADDARAQQVLQWLIIHEPDSPYLLQARNLLAALQSRSEVNPKAIGVLLPLSGRFKQYGERSLQAIELALGPSSGYTCVVKDTQAEASVASQALEELVLKHHVIAVIGPLFSNEAWAAAHKAQELHVPLLALSHREGLPQVGPYIFRTALTVTAQAQALAHVAVDLLGMRRFAILAPQSRYGMDFSNVFWDEIEKRHAEIRGIETYEPEQTTFRKPVRRLVGRWYFTDRQDYREAMAKLKQRNLTTMRMHTQQVQLEKNLPPIVDFEAIVIPDSGRQIGLIAPALAFEDIILTHDTHLLDRIRKVTGHPQLQPVTLLGASTWNSSQTLDSCENYCEDAIFVDAFFANSTDPKVRDFIAAFREVSGAEPYLGEAQAYDTAALLRTVLSRQPLRSREDLRESLVHLETYHGVSSSFRFDNQGEAQKELFTLTIKDHTIRLHEPDPARPSPKASGYPLTHGPT